VGAARAHPAHQPLEQRAQQAHRQRLPGAPRKLSSSSINSIAALGEATGADVREVARAIGADSRIVGKFLQSGPGFGGSCFQKDILNLVVLCRHYGLHEVAATWEQVVELNTWQQHRLARLVVNSLFGTVTGKRIGVLGFAYGLRPTASTRPTPTTPRIAAGFSAGVSPAIRICRDLLEEGAVLAILDPKVSEHQIAADLGMAPGSGEGSWHLVADANQAASGADALLLLSEWPQFAALVV
jgi:UDPglucose 6-dehydrogenase